MEKQESGLAIVASLYKQFGLFGGTAGTAVYLVLDGVPSFMVNGLRRLVSLRKGKTLGDKAGITVQARKAEVVVEVATPVPANAALDDAVLRREEVMAGELRVWFYPGAKVVRGTFVPKVKVARKVGARRLSLPEMACQSVEAVQSAIDQYKSHVSGLC